MLTNVQNLITEPTEKVRPYLFQKGRSGNPGGRTAIQAETRRIAKDLCPEAMNRIAEIMRQTDDVRASLIAAQTILDRGIGKVKDAGADDDKKPFDMSAIPPQALEMIKQALKLMMVQPSQEVLPPEKE